MSHEQGNKAPACALYQYGTVTSDGFGAIEIPGYGSLYPTASFAPVLTKVRTALANAGAAGLSTTQDAAMSGGQQAAESTIVAAGTAVLVETQALPASGLDIIANFDTSITSLGSTLRNEIENAVSAAINFYETTFSNSITFAVNFGYGEVNGEGLGAGSLAESAPNSDVLVSYATLRGALESHITALGASPLPVSDPFGGTTKNWTLTFPEAMALGISTGSTMAGWVGISNAASFNYSTTNGAVAGEYNLVGVLEHEISEVMGRVVGYGVGPQDYPLDLFRYRSPGTLAMSGTTPSYFSINAGTTDLAAFNNSSTLDFGDWASSVTRDSYDAVSSIGVANTVSAVDLTEMQVLGYNLTLCFVAGTRIATPLGEVPVEWLSIGDLVLTLSGKPQPIVWIGVGRVPAARAGRGPGSPVVIRRGALADNVPHRDLRVTKGHALYLDGVLIPAEELVNGHTIMWDDGPQELTIYHIELATHDVLLANGAPAESYRDDGNRWLFHNANPTWHLPPRPLCAPLLTNGPLVDTVWRRLLERAGPFNASLTEDADMHLLVDGRRVNAIERHMARQFFRLEMQPRQIRLRSRATVPQDLGLARDPRLLGVAVRRLAFSQALQYRTVEATELTDGYHGYEPADDIRWTDGDAAVPASLFSGMRGPGILTVYLGPTTQYLDADQPGAHSVKRETMSFAGRSTHPAIELRGAAAA